MICLLPKTCNKTTTTSRASTHHTSPTVDRFPIVTKHNEIRMKATNGCSVKKYMRTIETVTDGGPFPTFYFVWGMYTSQLIIKYVEV